MEVDHDLVVVDEFDALAIEVKVAPDSAGSSSGSKSAPLSPLSERESFLAAEKVKLRQELSGLRSKLGKYPAKQHARKVVKELGVQNGLIYLLGQEDIPYEDSDMTFEFRQRRYFYYISGADFAGCHVTYDIHRDHLMLWIPYNDPRFVLWHGLTPNVEECMKSIEVDEVRFAPGLERYLFTALTPGSTLYLLHKDQQPKMENSKGLLHIDSTKLKAAMDAARVIKTDYEVAMIRRANIVSSAAHRAVLARLKRLNNEREIDAIFRGFCLAQGAKHQAYPVIAGAGTNASVLHYWQNDSPLAGRQVVVIDASAEWDLYASDITRTLPLTGQFTEEAAEIYRIVQRMQDECIARIKPGLVFFTLHLHACMVAITELLKLGILQGGTASEIFLRGTVGAFFPHALGHHIGLEAHDVSGRERLMSGSAVQSINGRRSGRGALGKREFVSAEGIASMYRESCRPGPYSGRQALEKNMIVTIEPGIYFCREYIKACYLNNPLHAKYINITVLEKYYPVGGVRIEDDILVTDDGYENLTSAPKGDEALKIINNQES